MADDDVALNDARCEAVRAIVRCLDVTTNASAAQAVVVAIPHATPRMIWHAWRCAAKVCRTCSVLIATLCLCLLLASIYCVGPMRWTRTTGWVPHFIDAHSYDL